MSEAEKNYVTGETKNEVLVREFEPPRFSIHVESEAKAMTEYLEEHGYAVVASVASPEQIEMAKTDFWNIAEECRPGLKRDDPSTWDQHWLGTKSTGIIGFSSFNHSDFLWNTRCLPDVESAFQLVWGANPAAPVPMLVSFDGGNAFRPWRLNPLWLTEGGWWHVDQNSRRGAHRTGRACIQGLVTYTDCNAATGGFCAIPGSHRDHDALCARADGARMGIDFVPVPEGDPCLARGGLLLAARAGDLILWDSRTVHCNTPALDPRLDAPPPPLAPGACPAADLLRLVAYVCMLPRARVPADALPRRRAAFVHGFPTSHWPDHAPPEPGPGGPPGRDPRACSERVRRLVGFDDGEGGEGGAAAAGGGAGGGQEWGCALM